MNELMNTSARAYGEYTKQSISANSKEGLVYRSIYFKIRELIIATRVPIPRYRRIQGNKGRYRI